MDFVKGFLLRNIRIQKFQATAIQNKVLKSRIAALAGLKENG
jgi:hypothetical protein